MTNRGGKSNNGNAYSRSSFIRISRACFIFLAALAISFRAAPATAAPSATPAQIDAPPMFPDETPPSRAATEDVYNIFGEVTQIDPAGQKPEKAARLQPEIIPAGQYMKWIITIKVKDTTSPDPLLKPGTTARIAIDSPESLFEPLDITPDQATGREIDFELNVITLANGSKRNYLEIIPVGQTQDSLDCSAHADCLSGVCDHQKAGEGVCAPSKCPAGETTDNNNFFCDDYNGWRHARGEGDPCVYDYECHRPTCYMNPGCGASEIPRQTATCLENSCALTAAPDKCEMSGKKTILARSEYNIDSNGRCYETLEQRQLTTVCAPCGNGLCDQPLESKCNCPRDCE